MPGAMYEARLNLFASCRYAYCPNLTIIDTPGFILKVIADPKELLRGHYCLQGMTHPFKENVIDTLWTLGSWCNEVLQVSSVNRRPDCKTKAQH